MAQSAGTDLPADLVLSNVLLNLYLYKFPEIEVPMPPTEIPITVGVNLDNDFINPQEMIKRFQSKATIKAFETVGHRF